MDANRRRALGFASTASLALLAGKASAAQATELEGPRLEPQDEWLDEGGRRHRIVFDTLSTAGLGLGMNFAKNFFTANKAGYGIDAGELSVVVILRHNSTAFAFSDGIWAKYSGFFASHVNIIDPCSKSIPQGNLFLNRIEAPGLPNGETTLDDLIKLGARFAVCSMAASNLAKAITGPSHGDSAGVLKELEANLVPNALMVPAGITAVNRAQERGYTFSYCG